MNKEQIKIAEDIINARISELTNPYVERIASLEALVVELHKHIGLRDSTIKTRSEQFDELINEVDNYRQLSYMKDQKITILSDTILELKESVRLQSQIIAAKEAEIKIEQRKSWFKKLFA